MSRQFSILHALLLSVICMNGQQVTPNINTPVTASTYPFHKTFQNQSNQASVLTWQPSATAATQQNSSLRSLVYQQLAYRMDVWNAGAAGWQYMDSASYTYTSGGLPTAETRLQYSNPNWADFIKVSYTYDGAGNELTYLNQTWNAQVSNWLNVSQMAYTYDSHNRLLTTTSQLWNAQQNQWTNTQQNINTYDGYGNIEEQQSLTWNATANAWVNLGEYLYGYDAKNRETSAIYQIWFNDTGWAAQSQTLYQYDSVTGNIDGTILQKWQPSGWVNGTQTLYTYDARNNVIETIVQTGQSGTTSPWANSARTNNVFDSQNNRLSTTSYLWDVSLSSWDSASRNLYTYNTANLELTEIDALYGGGTFNNTNKYQYTYDDGFKNIRLSTYTWTPATASWTPLMEYDYSYDANNNINYELDKGYDAAEQKSIDVNQYYFYYEPFEASGIKDLSNDLSAMLYPNPVSGNDVHLTMTLDDNTSLNMRVYDQEGRLITAETQGASVGANNYDIAVPAITPGYYYVQLVDRNTGKSSVLKFIKE